MSMMNLHSGRRWFRRGLVGSVLALFLLGTNYCLLAASVAALGGTPPACHAQATKTGTGGNHDCCGAASGSGRSAPHPPPAGFPCCIQIAPPGVADSGKPDPGHADFVALATAAEPAAVLPDEGFVLRERVGPPGATPPDLTRGRAPPLS